MTTRALAMPPAMVDLIRLPFLQMGLQPIYEGDDMVLCPLHYEDGTEVHVVVMCVRQSRLLLPDKQYASVAFAVLGEGMEIRTMLHKDRLPIPKGTHDLQFVLKLSTMVRATAWTIADIAGMGDCIELPIRENFRP